MRYLNPRQDKTTSGFGKGTAAILELCFRFRFWPIYSHQQVILHQPVKFRHNRTIGGEVMTSYRFFKMAVIESEIYFRFRFWWWYSFGKMEIYWHTKFRWHIQFTAGIKLFPVSFWISISDFYFWLIFVIGVPFCIGIPYFVKIVNGQFQAKTQKKITVSPKL